jgi:hypothetical protein
MIYWLLLLLAVSLGGLGAWLRQRSPLPGNALILVACAGVAGCFVWQVRHTVLQPTVSGPDRGQAVVSYVLANHVMAEVGPRHGTVVLLFPPTSVFDEEAVGTYAGTFSRVLRGFPALKVETITLPAVEKSAKPGLPSLNAFRQAISTKGGAVAYVSFAGLPAGFEELRAATGQESPAFFIYDPWGTTNWLSALRKGWVRTVVLPRPDVRRKASVEVLGAPDELFDQLYLQATPETVEQLAARLGIH